MYEIATEYDGKEVAIIKPLVQYQVALCGIIKNEKPEISEINELLQQAPTHTGIWIGNNLKDLFLELLKNITNADYNIDEDGFLIQTQSFNMNKYDKAINKMLSDGNLYVFDINSTTYLVNNVTGETEEYPFEEMDPHQGYEYFESNNKFIFIISQNNSGKINQEEVLKEILGEIQ